MMKPYTEKPMRTWQDLIDNDYDIITRTFKDNSSASDFDGILAVIF